MHEEICYASAYELAEQVRRKAVSPVELVRTHLERIEAVNPKINAIVIFAEDALDRAKEAEAAVMRGDELGPLHGVPYTLKDCVETAGLRTTQGSKLFENYVSKSDATVYTRLRDAGGILLGKTNMPEFALWWETDNLVFGRTCNPWDVERTPGGSSGGEAAAIVSGLSPLGVGTDLGGSIREPAHFCGIFGLKPTLGRVPYTGIQPQTLLRAMHAGPLARSVQDIALGLSIMAGPDDLDIYAPPVPIPDYTALDSPLPELKVGWSPATGIPVEQEVQDTGAEAANALSEVGLKVEPIEIPGLVEKDAGKISSAIYLAEAGLHLSPIISGRESDLTEILRTRYVDRPPRSFDEYLEAAVLWAIGRELLLRAKEVAEYFTRYDLFLCPTVPMPAYPHGQTELTVEGQTVAGRHALRATVPWDLTGSPAISVPFGWSSDGLPIGVQLVGRHFDEMTVLRAAKALEACRKDVRRPPVG
ncbi:MAG: amidase [Dehalococcoidia bacterium]